MSKFDYDYFYNSRDSFAVSKERYTKEEAIEVAKREIGETFDYMLAIGDSFVIHRAGVNDDGKPCVGWWLEYTQRKRSCPAWAFHVVCSPLQPRKHDYEYIEVKTEEK